MKSLWTRGGLPWATLIRRIFREMAEDEIYGRSAELAYYFLFSLFPLLLFLTSLFGYVMGESASLRQELFDYLRRLIPNQAALQLVRDTLQEIIDRRGLKLHFGLLFSVWAAAQGVAGVGRVLDTAYDVEDTRPLWKAQLWAIGLTVVFAALLLTGLALVFWGASIADLLAHRFRYGATFTLMWKILQWPVILAFILGAFEVLYNFAPSKLSLRRIHWSTPGAAVGVTLWLVASVGLRAYVSQVDVYTYAYGSLGALIVLMLWFYITGFAILVGGEINAEITKVLGERQAG